MIGLTVHPSTSSGRTVKPNNLSRFKLVADFVERDDDQSVFDPVIIADLEFIGRPMFVPSDTVNMSCTGCMV